MSEPLPIPPPAPSRPNNHKRNRWLIGLTVGFLLIGLAWFAYWVFWGRFFVYTDNAYVTGNQVQLTPEVSGGVATIYADNTNLVREGELIIQLDRTPYEIKVEEMKGLLAQTVRYVSTLFEAVKEGEANVRLKRAELIQNKLDLSYREGLTDSGAISIESFQQAQTNVLVSESELQLAESQLVSAKLKVENTTIEQHPLVITAIEALRQSYLDLLRCEVYAPATGFIAKRIAQVGDWVLAGSPLLTIVPLDQIWIEANYKETQLKNVRIGQPVRFTADLYGREVKFHGFVLGFSAGTGSAFALLPAQNASGNWIKIVQRVPIRISVQPEEIQEHPLLIGLSMHVYVDVEDRCGKMLAETPTFVPVYKTDLYEQRQKALDEFEEVIESIVAANISSLNYQEDEEADDSFES